MHLREYESQLLNILHPYVLSSCPLRHILSNHCHQAGYCETSHRDTQWFKDCPIKYLTLCTSMFSVSLTFHLLWTHISEMSASLARKNFSVRRFTDDSIDNSDISEFLSPFQIEKFSFLFKSLNQSGSGFIDVRKIFK